MLGHALFGFVAARVSHHGERPRWLVLFVDVASYGGGSPNIDFQQLSVNRIRPNPRSSHEIWRVRTIRGAATFTILNAASRHRHRVQEQARELGRAFGGTELYR